MKDCTYGEKLVKVSGEILFHKNHAWSHDIGVYFLFGPGTVASMDENINANKYQVILKGTSNLWPVVPHLPEGGYSFQDNVMVHRAILIVKYKTRNHILSLFWTALSPNLNIIEILWLLIKFGLIKPHNLFKVYTTPFPDKLRRSSR